VLNARPLAEVRKLLARGEPAAPRRRRARE